MSPKIRCFVLSFAHNFFNFLILIKKKPDPDKLINKTLMGLFLNFRITDKKYFIFSFNLKLFILNHSM